MQNVFAILSDSLRNLIMHDSVRLTHSRPPIPNLEKDALKILWDCFDSTKQRKGLQRNKRTWNYRGSMVSTPQQSAKKKLQGTARTSVGFGKG